MSSRNHIVRYDAAIFIRSAKSRQWICHFAHQRILHRPGGRRYLCRRLFTAAGKTLANRIARWDGTNWNTVGGGTMGGASSANRVLAIAGLGSDVFVGGTFTNVGGINVKATSRVGRCKLWNMAWASTPVSVAGGHARRRFCRRQASPSNARCC